MRLAVTGGGTGGHVYPAVAVATALQQAPMSVPPEDVLYLGLQGGLEETVATQGGFAFAPISAAPMRGRGPAGLVSGGVRILAGIAQASRALKHFDVQAVLATGGYVSVPVGLAAWLRKIPLLLYVPDLEPGLAVRLLAYFARTIAVTAPTTAKPFPAAKTVVTGYPVRAGFGARSREAARTRFGLSPALKTLLVWGGSQGAQTLNLQVAQGCEELLTACQLVHICGAADAPWLEERRSALPDDLRPRYHLYPYLYDEMPEAMAAADLAVSRSGASILGEFPLAGLPAILVPYPYAGGHQRLNARYLADAGAAVVLEEEEIGRLVLTVLSLFQEEARLAQMAARSRALAHPDAAKTLATFLVGLTSAKSSPVAFHTRVD